jgi:hypothetical protein
MPAEPMPVEQPKHPTSQLTTSELSRYRRELERSLKTLPTQATVRAQLRARLGEVLAEQDQRNQLAQTVRRGPCGL